MPHLPSWSALARRRGVKTYKLPIPYAAHHPALQSAADTFHDSIALLPRLSFRVPVYSAVSRRRYTEADNLARLLADCFTKPYHMPEALQESSIQGAIYIDLSMTGMMRSSIRSILPKANVLVPTRTLSAICT